MALEYKIWDFPNFPVKSQLFSVPGSAFDGGFTSGGARIISPEPGGRALLEMEIALQVDEWTTPLVSWLMSKINGEIFRIPLTRTPQLVSNLAFGIGSNIGSSGVPWEQAGVFPDSEWDNDQFWSDDGIVALASIAGLEGSNSFTIDMSAYGEILKHGHVIGIGEYSYIVDDIEYDETVATVTVKPPLRNSFEAGEYVLFRPYFLGTIANGESVKTMYDISNVGHIQPGTIIFHEAVI